MRKRTERKNKINKLSKMFDRKTVTHARTENGSLFSYDRFSRKPLLFCTSFYPDIILSSIFKSFI